MMAATAAIFSLLLLATATPMRAQDSRPASRPTDPWLVCEPNSDARRPQHIVFVTGEEEYRSEESVPQLAKILAQRHGFRCTVLFSIDPETGAIDPDVRDHIPGLEELARADLLVLFTRFRDLPDAQMRHLADYLASGKPIVGLRTATHAFQIPAGRAYARWDWRSEEWPGGFGRQVLGETWIAHHGRHGAQGTRGVAAPGAGGHPILRGIEPGTIWDPADVYAVRRPLPDGCAPLVLGLVLDGTEPGAPPVAGAVNDPPMPIAWTRILECGGRETRVFTTTLGSAQAFAHEGSRRLLVNACYWALGLEGEIDGASDVRPVGAYAPSRFGFGGAARGVRPDELR